MAMKLTESKLDWIVKESVDKVLKEDSISRKKGRVRDVEKAFRERGGGRDAIKSICVFTAENPDSTPASAQFNKKHNHSLLKDIKRSGYAFCPVKGKFGSTEHPYAVINMPKESASFLCGKYQQTSFIYSEFLGGGKVYSEYWEKEDVSAPFDEVKNPYVCKDSCEDWNDMSGADDYYTIVGNKFKYSIPFSIFENIQKVMNINMDYIIEQSSAKYNKDFLLEFAFNRVGQSPYLYRKAINKGLI